MPNRARLLTALLTALLLGSTGGCGGSLTIGTPAGTGGPKAPAQLTNAQTRAVASTAQRPGTCQVAPPQVHLPTGEWTATRTILTTNAIDFCAGERQLWPWDFRRLCKAGKCQTFLFSADYYRVDVARIVPDGHDKYVALFEPTPVPCPHRPGEDAGTNQYHSTVTLRWSPEKQMLYGFERAHQVGRCGGGPYETSSYVATRTNPAANPPAQGP
jgi:hypothetical protein